MWSYPIPVPSQQKENPARPNRSGLKDDRGRSLAAVGRPDCAGALMEFPDKGTPVARPVRKTRASLRRRSVAAGAPSNPP